MIDIEVLSLALAEVVRQESRVDVKAGQVASFAGTFATLAFGVATLLGAFSTRSNGFLVGPLLLAGLLWLSSVAVLMLRIIRPRLGPSVRGTFAHADHIEHLRAMTPDSYREELTSGLGTLVLKRYRAIRLAVDLLVLGFVPLILAGVIASLRNL